MNHVDPILDSLSADLAALHAVAPVGMLLLEAEGSIRWASQRACEMLGVSPTSIAGRHMLDFLVADDPSRYDAALAYGSGYTNGIMGPMRIRYRRQGQTSISESDAWTVNALDHPDIGAFVVVCTEQTAEAGFSRALAAIAEGRSVESILTELAHSLRGHPFTSKGCWLVDDGARRLVGVDSLSPLLRSVLAGDGPWWDELGSSKPFILDNVGRSNNPNVRALASAGIRALWWSPVVGSAGSSVSAASVVLRTMVGAPSPNHGEHLVRLTDIAAIAFDRHALTSRLANAANLDDLTGLGNRLQFFEWFRQGVPAGTAVFTVDVDRLGSINDSYGEAAGDAVLIECAERIEQLLRPADNVARIGEDEFVVICPDIFDWEDLARIAQRLVTIAHDPVDAKQPIGFSVRVGATRTSATMPASVVLQSASAALADAKRVGPNQWRASAPLD